MSMHLFKRLIIGLFLILSVGISKAQEIHPQFGIKGGLNVTFFHVDQQALGSYNTSETGYYGGMFVEFPIDGFLAIQPEALYISVGDFNFLNIPVYAKYEVAHKLYLMAGPSVNYFFDFYTNKLKIGADINTSYNLNRFLDAHIKFALGFEELAPNGLFFGLGVRL